MNSTLYIDNADEEMMVSDDDDSAKDLQEKVEERIELKTSYNFKTKKPKKKNTLKINAN